MSTRGWRQPPKGQNPLIHIPPSRLLQLWTVERVGEDDESKAMAIVGKYVDKTFSYTDATSVAVMERLGLKTVFAFDPHFRQYGFQVAGISTPS